MERSTVERSTFGSTVERRAARELSREAAYPTCIITEVWGYPVATYKVFILSLLATGYRGAIKLLAPPNRTRPESLAFLQSTRRVDVLPIAQSTYHSSDRFVKYMELCAKGRFAYCIVSDFRDVFFQSDPFASIIRHAKEHGADATPELVLPLEKRAIGDETSNQYALRRCFGKPVLDAMINHTIICSGVLLGTPAAFAALPPLMVSLAHRCKFDKMSDQAALNFMMRAPHHLATLRGDTGAPLRIAYEEQGGAGTFSHNIGTYKLKDAALRFVGGGHYLRNGLVRNDDGRVVPMVHQFDRPLRTLHKLQPSPPIVRNFSAIAHALSTPESEYAMYSLASLHDAPLPLNGTAAASPASRHGHTRAPRLAFNFSDLAWVGEG